MTLPIDRTAKAVLDLNLVNGILSDGPKIKASNDVVYNTIDELNAKVNTNYATGATGTTQLADGSVTTAKHADGSVTTAKIADSAVTLAKMADSSVGTTELVDQSVTNGKVANATLTADKFVAGALTNETQNALRITALQAENASQMVNVKYPPSPLVSAVGNGTTDDTTAIQAAINYVGAAGGGSVFLPKGTYRTTGTLTMKPKTFLVGPVPGNVYYDKADPTSAIIQYEGNGWAIQFPEGADHASQSGLRNLSILGNDYGLGGYRINETASPAQPSLDLIFDGVCVAYFRTGYGLSMLFTWRNNFYNCVFRQCGVGISGLTDSNAINFYGTTIEWCNLGASFYGCKSVNMYGSTLEGLGNRPDITTPSDLIVWTDGGKSLADYNGIVRNLGSLVNIIGGHIEEIDGTHFIKELAATTTIMNMEIECNSATVPHPHQNYVVDKAAESSGLTFMGNRIYASPLTAIINLHNSSFNVNIPGGNAWSGDMTVPFFVNIGEHIDGGTIQAPNDAVMPTSSYGYKAYGIDEDNNSYVRLFGPYDRDALDNFWEWYRQNGTGPNKFSMIRRMNNGVFENYIQFDPGTMYLYKPLIMDAGQYSRLGHTASLSPQEGDMYWDAVGKTIKVYNGTAWKSTTLT